MSRFGIKANAMIFTGWLLAVGGARSPAEMPADWCAMTPPAGYSCLREQGFVRRPIDPRFLDSVAGDRPKNGHPPAFRRLPG
jgi:hypothetical protein